MNIQWNYGEILNEKYVILLYWNIVPNQTVSMCGQLIRWNVTLRPLKIKCLKNLKPFQKLEAVPGMKIQLLSLKVFIALWRQLEAPCQYDGSQRALDQSNKQNKELNSKRQLLGVWKPGKQLEIDLVTVATFTLSLSTHSSIHPFTHSIDYLCLLCPFRHHSSINPSNIHPSIHLPSFHPPIH